MLSGVLCHLLRDNSLPPLIEVLGVPPIAVEFTIGKTRQLGGEITNTVKNRIESTEQKINYTTRVKNIHKKLPFD